MASILPPHPVEKNNRTKEFDEQSILPPHPNKKDGSSQEFKEQSTLPPTGGSTLPPTGSSYSKYFGKYKGSGLLPDFEIKEKNGKLIADNGSGDVELTFVSGNKFKGKVSGLNAEIEFTVSNNVSTGGNVTVAGQTISFTKTTSTPSKPDEPSPPKPPSVWDCIEKYNKENNANSLYDRDEYRYEKVDLERDNKPTIFKYYKDGRVDWAYYKDQKPILQGKWECRGDNGYIIKWSNGNISTYNVKTGGGLEGNSNNTATNTSENICPNGYKEGCVSKADILGKKKALKACSKCDLVKEVQENPEIKARIFRLQKEAGQPEKTDNVFGPIMLAAIKEFQSSHGINPTGNVGELTLAKINPSQASQFYLDRGGKKFKSGDKNGGAVDYLKAQQIKDDFDEADGVIYFMVGVGLKDKNAACSALIKSMERGELDSAEYYDARKCSEISGFPSYADVIKLYRTKLKSGKTPTTVQEPKVNNNEPVINKTDDKNKPVIKKTDDNSTNKPQVKPIYRRSSRQVLRPDEEL
jgi:peptidoglycan hydrolase-like protein with peptidoglycan-binding domain